MPTETNRSDPVLLTAQQVADMLNVTREFIYRLCASGELKSLTLASDPGKPGRARRIFATSVEDYLERVSA